MKTLILLTLLLYSLPSFSCGGHGLFHDEISLILKKVEEIIPSKITLKGYGTPSVSWRTINASSGIEGDCEAKSLSGKAKVFEYDENTYNRCSYYIDVSYSLNKFLTEEQITLSVEETSCTIFNDELD